MSETNDNMKLITEDQIREITPEELELGAAVQQEKAPAPAKASKKQSKKKKKCDTPLKKTTIGGQALIEGVMMVGPSRTAMAVRKGDGTIYVEEIICTPSGRYGCRTLHDCFFSGRCHCTASGT